MSEHIVIALRKLRDSTDGTIHWRGIYSPLGCKQELLDIGYAERAPIIISGMDRKGAKITKQGLAFLMEQDTAGADKPSHNETAMALSAPAGRG